LGARIMVQTCADASPNCKAVQQVEKIERFRDALWLWIHLLARDFSALNTSSAWKEERTNGPEATMPKPFFSAIYLKSSNSSGVQYFMTG